jgi:large subunit ribosomal protein L31
MKKDIHPQYFKNAKATCTCGATFELGSTASEIRNDICSKCHPVYTGNKKYIDSAGRLDKFKERMTKTAQLKDKLKAEKAKKTIDSPAKEETAAPTSEN